MNERVRMLYRAASLGLALAFGAAGVIVVLAPEATIAFFNTLGRSMGLAEAPISSGVWVALAGAYLYIVTALAVAMGRFPEQPIYPLLLCQAKGASGALLLGWFALRAPAPAALIKGTIDALLCAFLLGMYLVSRAAARSARSARSARAERDPA
jgi:hypothetical protein